MRRVCLAALCLQSSFALAATWTVNQLGDAGDGVCDQTCTLRDAVAALAADDRIGFSLALPNPLLIDLTGPALVISVPSRMTANDGVRTELRRASGQDRLLVLQNGAQVRITGLGFLQGQAPVPPTGGPGVGGAIRVEAGAELTCRYCLFAHNLAQGVTPPGSSPPGSAGASAAGGAIDADGALIIDGAVFFDNRAIAAGGMPGGPFFAPGGSGGAAYGGAIAARGLVDIVNSTFYDNRAIGGDGASGGTSPMPPGFNGGNGGNALGGAVYFGSASAPTIAFSTLAKNVALPGLAGSGGVNGGSNGAPGQSQGAAISADATSILNTSVVFGHAVAACAGTAPTQRTSNRVDEASCPGQILANLEADLEPIDLMHPSPAFVPKLGSRLVDTSPDCLDAPAVEAVVLDQRLAARPLLGGVGLACDFGAIEYTEVILKDSFEDPLPPL